MLKAQTVQKIAGQISGKATTECEKVVELHDYVRENVKFGFNKYLDATPSGYTFSCQHGHCWCCSNEHTRRQDTQVKGSRCAYRFFEDFHVSHRFVLDYLVDEVLHPQTSSK